MKTADVIVIGGGIAGASAAAEIAAAGAQVLLLEMESQPGYHATGRSAAMYEPSEGAPIVRAWENGRDEAGTWEDAETYASGLRVPSAVGDFLMLRVLRASRGGAVAVTDRAMAEWVGRLGADTGIFAAPEGGAAAAAVPLLLERRMIDAEDEVVLFNTGSGLKYVGMVPLS